jgi:tetratricopeptide (TPR) repeat protein
MTEQQVAEALAQLTQKAISGLKPGLGADALQVTGEMSQRQLTQGAHIDPNRTTPMPFFATVQDFQTTGVEALRREDLRKVLATLAKDLKDRAQHVGDAAKSRSTIPPYNRRFVGRLDELALLRERLHQGRTGVISGHKGDLPEDKSTITSVHGLGGIGKTELAFTYAHAFAGLYPGGRFLVPCDGHSDIRLALLALDETFRDQISDEQRKSLDLHFGAIRDCLRHRLGELGRILLVLDNVTDAALLRPEQTDPIRVLGPDLHLLATTRLGAPEGGGTYDDVHWLTLGELGLEDSLRLLEKHRSYATPAEQTAAEQIARWLGGFALCVEVVGAYLGQHPEQSYAGCMETMGLQNLQQLDLTAERRDVMTRRHNNEKRLGAIFAPTLRSLPAEAVTALEFAAFLPPDHIVLPWLLQLVGSKHSTVAGSPDAWQHLVARLVSLALLTRGQDGDHQALDESHQPRILRCHRLLQDFTRGRLTAAGKTTLQQAVDALVKARAAALEQTTQWQEARWELEPLAALGYAWAEANRGEAAWLLTTVGLRLHYLADWSHAEPLLRRALAIEEQQFGPQHLNVASALNNLAGILFASNRITEAENLFRRALNIWMDSHGEGHPVVARGLNNLASLFAETNRAKDAEPLIRAALQIDLDNFGHNDQRVAEDMNTLGQVLERMNRLDEAEDFRRDALAIWQNILGVNHPDVGIATSNLATILVKLGRFSEAEPLIRRALSMAEDIYGPRHPTISIRLNSLSTLLSRQGRYSEAEPLCRRSLEIIRNNYEPDHPHVATALNNLAQLLMKSNRPSEAEPYLRRAIEIVLTFNKNAGHIHPHLNEAVNDYVNLLIRMDMSHEEALAQLNAIAAPFGLNFGETK